MSHPCLALDGTEARPLWPATGAGLRARRHDRPRRFCPLPVREALQAEMRTHLDDSQIEVTSPNVDGADTTDLAFPVTDPADTPDPVFLVLDHDGVCRSTSHPDPSIRLHSKGNLQKFAVTNHSWRTADGRSMGIFRKLMAERQSAPSDRTPVFRAVKSHNPGPLAPCTSIRNRAHPSAAQLPCRCTCSPLQRCNRRKCAHLLRDLAAAADLPPNSALFAQQLLDRSHRWSEREDNDIDIGDIHLLAAGVHVHFKLHSVRYPDPVPQQFPDPQQPRKLADLTATAALLARRQPHSAPLQHSAWTIQEVVTEASSFWGQSTTSLAPTRQQLGSESSSSTSPCGISSSFSCRSARPFHFFSPTCLLGVHKKLLTCTWICVDVAGV